jgi:alkylation response protein AidB-like acyl-CoA dehydrogenase
MISTSLDAAALAESVRPSIVAHREAADRLRRLPAELTEILRDAGAFRLSTPVERDGFELPLAPQVEIYEALGRIDGPVAWNIWNGNIGFAAALLDEGAADRIWTGDRDPIIANSARVAGAGAPVEGGFELSGRWDMVSAIDIADWVALFAMVMDGDGPRMTPTGPDVRVFFVPAADVEVLDTWHTTGMRGTGSKTVVVDATFVSEGLAISPFSRARIDRPLFRVPAFTIASIGVAPIVIGIAQALVDEIVRIAPTKGTDDGRPLAERAHAQSQIASAQMALDAARLLLGDAAATIDAAAAADEDVSELLRARLRAAMSHAASVGREILSTGQLLASSSAVYTDNRIEHLVRDGQVAAQHMLLSPTHLDILGRLTLGLDAGTAIV